MPAQKMIRMTLTGPYEGETKTINTYDFVDGVCYFLGNDEQCESVTRYFTRSFQVKSEVITDDFLRAEAEAKVDDSAVLDNTKDETKDETEDEDDPVQPNARQAEIIAAVNLIEKDQWVDLQSKTPRPKAKHVQELMSDPTITAAEITEVIETWLL